MQGFTNEEEEDNEGESKDSWLKIISLIVINLIVRYYSMSVPGVSQLGLFLISGIISAKIKQIIFPYHPGVYLKPNTTSFVKDVLMCALLIYIVYSYIVHAFRQYILFQSWMSPYPLYDGEGGVSDYDKAESSNSTDKDLVKSPLDQFEIRNLLSLDAPILVDLQVSLTNIRLYLTISAAIALMLNFLATNYNKLISNRWSISQESIYATLNSIVINQINANKGQMYFPFIYTLFIFVLINNLIGMVPYSFASTSHFSLTFFISFTVVLAATILGFIKHGLKFFSLFVPGGCPLALLPLLVLIEFISYLARNVSLGLRLAANILSGHMLLNILSGFTYNIMTSAFLYFFIGLIPLAFIIAFSGLELGIAFIQAQVFVVLTSSYIKDALDLH